MIKTATHADCKALAEMAVQMWSESSVAELESDFCEIINSNTYACFIKYSDNLPIGFAKCSLRNDYVEGTSTSPVGYLEGVFISKEYRNKGYGTEAIKLLIGYGFDYLNLNNIKDEEFNQLHTY